MNLLYIPAVHQLAYSRNVSKCVPKPHALMLKNSTTSTLLEITATVLQIQKKQGKQVHGIIVSDLKLVKQYLKREVGIELVSKDEANLQNYAGCMFSHTMTTPAGEKYTIPVVVIEAPEPLQFSDSAVHLTTRFISKLYDPTWFTAPKLEWELGNLETLPALWEKFNSPAVRLIAVDIETKLEEIDYEVAEHATINGVPTAGMYFSGIPRTAGGGKSSRLANLMPIITCVGYCAIIELPSGALTSYTVVIPMRSEQHRRWIAKFNQLPAPKVMQNGRYDASYFLRYGIPLDNWVFDTYGMMHCWLVELRRGLEHIAAYTIRNHMYWKDESSGNLYEYNAKDCHTTAWACLVLLSSMPSWAITNFVGIFKQVFPCITCGIEGLAEDRTEALKLKDYYQQELAANTEWWNSVVCRNFNISSPNQVKQLFQTMLKTGIKDTSANSLKGIMHKHPLWRLMVEKLLDSRQSRKADSTYMDIVTFCGRILYELDPFGTDTGRYASKSSNFWCGTQIQNIPVYAKSMFIADAGWELNSIDNSQSESRTTAYIVGDTKLIDAVENAPDFHTRNASMFFGIPEAELFRLKKSPLKEEQDLFKKYRNKIGKRVNHGANYNMGEEVLIQTMTPLGIIEAKLTLKLPATYSFRQVAAYLLGCFDRAYPLVRSKEPGGYHYAVIQEVRDTGCLKTPDNWVRKTFLKPWASKQDLNALVAHKPQSWSVRSINRAFFDSWHRYQLVEDKIRMKAQVHDEIFFQAKPEDMEYVTLGISELMARPNHYTADTTGLGVAGEMIIPNSPKFTGVRNWAELKD